MDPWTSWLLQDHPEAELRDWARRLRVFRFVRAAGGLGNDDDALIAAYRYGALPELEAALARVGVTLTTHATPPPQPVPGRAYRGDEMMAFPSLIPGTTTEQPKHRRIADQAVFVWCGTDRLEFTVHQGYVVDDACVARAERLEAALAALALPRIEPPVDNRHCVCPKYYPAYFQAPPAGAQVPVRSGLLPLLARWWRGLKA